MVQDYERSFIGSFIKAIYSTYLPSSGEQYELFFTIAKFEGNMGYSLTQNYDEVQVEVDLNDQPVASGVNSQRDKVETLDMREEASLPRSHEHSPHTQHNNQTLLSDATKHVMEAKGFQNDPSQVQL